MCDNKGPTITIIKLKGESTIIGGYNPINWDINKHGNYENTSDSFIFSLDKEIILSRVSKYDTAIFQSSRGISFRDLQLIDYFSAEKGIYFTHNSYSKKYMILDTLVPKNMKFLV
uniref:TLDc domain-containing protein n=1 Tax=Rhizophagus irregularis (strain DAOM 181602 / DAOM 197198 / MUCL 43194) TaxID=747089 RepID=U9V2U7_RHIID